MSAGLSRAQRRAVAAFRVRLAEIIEHSARDGRIARVYGEFAGPYGVARSDRSYYRVRARVVYRSRFSKADIDSGWVIELWDNPRTLSGARRLALALARCAPAGAESYIADTYGPGEPKITVAR